VLNACQIAMHRSSVNHVIDLDAKMINKDATLVQDKQITKNKNVLNVTSGIASHRTLSVMHVKNIFEIKVC